MNTSPERPSSETSEQDKKADNELSIEYINPAIGPYERVKLGELMNTERKAKILGAQALLASEVYQGAIPKGDAWIEQATEALVDEFEDAEKASAMLIVQENIDDPESPVVAAADVRIMYGSGTAKAVLEAIAVDPERRSEGYGGDLLNKAEEYARSKGSDFMYLYANAKSKSEKANLLAWYESRGYKTTGQVLEDGALGMQKPIYKKNTPHA